jgi:hypothetical protein
MADTDTLDAMTTSQHSDEQVEDRGAGDTEEAEQPKRERWGQDPWEMRWGC